MSDGYAISPTDEELAEWTSGTVAQGFPEYYEDRHYELLDGMFEELIELRATIASVKSLANDDEYTSLPGFRADLIAALAGES